MQDQHNARRIPLGIIAAVSAALVVVGGCTQRQQPNSSQSLTTPTPTPTASVPSPPAESPTSEQPQPAQPLTTKTNQPTQTAQGETVKVYWVNDVNNKIEVVPTSILVKSAGKPDELLETAFDSLLAGPTDPAFSTTIPKGTKLRKLDVKPDGVHVDLSKDFTEGGGSSSMMGRVAQVIYTASTLEPSAKVWISVEGKPLEVLGGEGLMLDQPTTRTSFEQNFNL
jgi:spore germination protein GerM